MKEFEEASKEKKHLQCNLMEEVLMNAEKKKKKQAEWGSMGWGGTGRDFRTRAAELGGIPSTQGLGHTRQPGLSLGSSETLSPAVSRGVPGPDADLKELFRLLSVLCFGKVRGIKWGVRGQLPVASCYGLKCVSPSSPDMLKFSSPAL